jgi:ribonuclease III
MNPTEPSSVSPTPPIFLDNSERDSDGKIELCQQILDYRFQDVELLRSALTHASGASSRLASNERLEFLGDAVLGLTI